MESKQKVAVSILRQYEESPNKLYSYNVKVNKDYKDRFTILYRKMIKLKDNQVLTLCPGIYVDDVAEQIKKRLWYPSSPQFVFMEGSYIIMLGFDTRILVVQLSDN